MKHVEDKWKLLPEFLKIRGLVKQHIDSFNYFINQEVQEIVKANSEIRSNQDENFFLKFEKINIDMPSIEEDYVINKIMPHECRLRDLTYSAPITVDISYTRGRNIIKKNGIKIGQMPIMLGSSNCWLNNKSEKELAKIGECPYDPRGYFIIRGVEKVILIQEQMSKNRIIVELDDKQNFVALVNSSTHLVKSRAEVICKNEKFSMKQNIFTEEIPICIIFKAMGIESDQEIAQFIGTQPKFLEEMSLSLLESSKKDVLTQEQALNYIGARIKSKINRSGPNAIVKSKRDEAFDILKDVILPHIEVSIETVANRKLFISNKAEGK